MPCIRQRGKSWQALVSTPGKRVSRTFPTKAQAESWAAKRSGLPGTIEGARLALEDHRLACVVPRRLRDAIHRANFTEMELVNASFPLQRLLGVYFLIRDFEVVYVGKTTNVLQRLARHVRNGRVFEAFSFIPCEEEDLDELERTYIDLLMPRWNRMAMGPDMEDSNS